VADRIELRGLRALGRHGANPGERDAPQPFEVDLDIEVDLAPAGTSDDLFDTVDYGELALRVEAVIAETSYALLEALADAIVTAVLAEPRALAVDVSLRKLRPPVPVALDTAGVRIRRVASR
jgi:7,8-dihydroneopterin aldolase/epimerase/oxygenase